VGKALARLRRNRKLKNKIREKWGQALCAWKTVDRITKSTPQSLLTQVLINALTVQMDFQVSDYPTNRDLRVNRVSLRHR